MASAIAPDISSPPEDDDDEREMELEALCAIFPEIVIDAADSFTASLDLPIMPLVPIQISFTNEAILAAPLDNKIAPPVLDTHYLSHLPPLHVKFSLPVGYPASKPPNFELSTSPSWLPNTTLNHLQAEGERLWEDFGHAQVLFAFLDMLQDASSNAYGLADGKAPLDVSQGDKIALLDFNIKAKKEKFDRETFDCGICLDPKKGSVCHRMIDCGHVFCVQCLQDFYNNAITTGDLATVRCLAPNCAKEREVKSNAVSSNSRKPRKPKTFITPSELLQIPLDHEVVKRYVNLKHKADLETDKNTVYCPRKWCQGGARCKRHRKPEGLEILDDSGSESESDREENSLMRICEDCSFAFCCRCFQSWHGEYFICTPRTGDGELTEEDKASLEYVQMYSTSCPTCMVRSQKTFGCNHMICFKCGTHFCYLCSAWLSPENPYKHYNLFEGHGCYMRLWELEGGDGNDVGHGFAGNLNPEDLVDEDEDAAYRRRGVVALPPPVRRAEERQPPLAPAGPVIARHVREGPLVLRIEQHPAQPPAQQPPVPPPPPPPAINGRRADAVDRPQAQRNDLVRHARRAIEDEAQRRNRNPENMNREELVQQREWLERFVELALNDEEDDWDSDEHEGDGEVWEILPR